MPCFSIGNRQGTHGHDFDIEGVENSVMGQVQFWMPNPATVLEGARTNLM